MAIFIRRRLATRTALFWVITQRQWYFLTDVVGQTVGPIVHCVSTQKGAVLIYFARKPEITHRADNVRINVILRHIFANNVVTKKQ